MEIPRDQCSRKHPDSDTDTEKCIKQFPFVRRFNRLDCGYQRPGIRFDRSDWRDETIPAAGNGLNKTRLCGGIVENLADFVDGSSQTVVVVHKCVRRPELLANLFTRDKLARTRQKHGQQLERLQLQPHSYPVLSQLP